MWWEGGNTWKGEAEGREDRGLKWLLNIFSFCFLHLLTIGRQAKHTRQMRGDARKIMDL